MDPFHCNKNCKTSSTTELLAVCFATFVAVVVWIGAFRIYSFHVISRTQHNTSKVLLFKMLVGHCFEVGLLTYLDMDTWDINNTLSRYVIPAPSLLPLLNTMHQQLNCLLNHVSDQTFILASMICLGITPVFCLALPGFLSLCQRPVVTLLQRCFRDYMPADTLTDNDIAASGLITMFWAALLIFPLVTLLCVQLFTCQEVQAYTGSQFFLIADMTVGCGESWVILIQVLVAAPCFWFFGIGATSIVLYRAWPYRELLYTILDDNVPNAEDENGVQWWGRSRFAVIVMGYNPRFWYWEAVDVTRRTAIITAMVVFKVSDLQMQCLTCAVIESSFLLLSTKKQPHSSPLITFFAHLCKLALAGIYVVTMYADDRYIQLNWPNVLEFLHFLFFLCLVVPIFAWMVIAYLMLWRCVEDPPVAVPMDPYGKDAERERSARVASKDSTWNIDYENDGALKFHPPTEEVAGFEKVKEQDAEHRRQARKVKNWLQHSNASKETSIELNECGTHDLDDQIANTFGQEVQSLPGDATPFSHDVTERPEGADVTGGETVHVSNPLASSSANSTQVVEHGNVVSV